jgi:hypothetical protein
MQPISASLYHKLLAAAIPENRSQLGARNIVPIFDQVVLKAVGAWRAGANQDISVLRHYIPHAWALADKIHPTAFRL